jgi:hypothetical protein
MRAHLFRQATRGERPRRGSRVLGLLFQCWRSSARLPAWPVVDFLDQVAGDGVRDGVDQLGQDILRPDQRLFVLCSWTARGGTYLVLDRRLARSHALSRCLRPRSDGAAAIRSTLERLSGEAFGRRSSDAARTLMSGCGPDDRTRGRNLGASAHMAAAWALHAYPTSTWRR